MNKYSLILVKPAGKVTLSKLKHLSNAEYSIVVTLAGSSISVIPLLLNAEDLIVVNLLPSSKVTLAKFSQSSNALAPITVTVAGSSISSKLTQP